jgi:hypothetical protein
MNTERIHFPPVPYNKSPSKDPDLLQKQRIAKKLGLCQILNTYHTGNLLNSLPQLAKLVKKSTKKAKANQINPKQFQQPNQQSDESFSERSPNNSNIFSADHRNSHDHQDGHNKVYEFFKQVPIQQWHHNHNKSLLLAVSPAQPQVYPTQSPDGSILELPNVAPLFRKQLTQADKQFIRDYLNSLQCKFLTPNKRKLMSNTEIVKLISITGSAKETLRLLRLLGQPESYKEFNTLVEALEQLKHNLSEKRRAVQRFLVVNPSILRNSEEITAANIDKLVEVIGPEEILAHLDALKAQDISFEAFASLSEFIQQQIEKGPTENHSELSNSSGATSISASTAQILKPAHAALLDWLDSAACELFHKNFPGVNLNKNSAEVDKLLQLVAEISLEKQNNKLLPTESAEGDKQRKKWYKLAEKQPLLLAKRAIRLLKRLQHEVKHKFSELSGVLEAVQQRQQALINEKIIVLGHLSGAKKPCAIFHGKTQRREEIPQPFISEVDVDILCGDYSDVGEGDEASEMNNSASNSPINSNKAGAELSKPYSPTFNTGNSVSAATLSILHSFESSYCQFDSVLALIDAVLLQRRANILPGQGSSTTWQRLNRAEYENWHAEQAKHYKPAVNTMETAPIMPEQNTLNAKQPEEEKVAETPSPSRPIRRKDNDLKGFYRQDLLNFLASLRLFREETVYINVDLLDELMGSVQSSLAKKKAKKLLQLLQNKAQSEYTDRVFKRKQAKFHRNTANSGRSSALSSGLSSPRNNLNNTNLSSTISPLLTQFSAELDPILSISADHHYASLFAVLAYFCRCRRIFFDFSDLVHAVRSNIWSVSMENSAAPQSILDQSYAVEWPSCSSAIAGAESESKNRRFSKIDQNKSGTVELEALSSPSARSPVSEIRTLREFVDPADNDLESLIEQEMNSVMEESNRIQKTSVLSIPAELKYANGFIF